MPVFEPELSQTALSAQPEQTAKSVATHIKFITAVSTLGGLLFGYDSGMINGAMAYMQQDFQLTPLTEGMVTSSLLLGAAVGSLACGKLSDRVGRRRSILFLAVLFFFGAAACVVMPDATSMMMARFVLGLAVGGASVTVPTFLAEMAPASQRGRIVTRNELMIVLGVTLAFLCNSIIGRMWGGEHPGVWRWMFAVATLPAIGLMIGMLYVPESPRWLVSKGKMSEAWHVLKKIRELRRAREEFALIKANSRPDPRRAASGWKSLATPWMRRVFFIGIGIAVVQQATGVNAIMYYGTQILTSSGFGRETALIANVVNGFTAIAACMYGIHLLGKMGRRRMFLLGLAGTTLSLLLIAGFSAFLPASIERAWIILASMICFLIFIQGLIGPVTWLLLSEIFPLPIRGFAIGFSGFVLWSTNFVIGLIFPSLVAYIGVAATFTIFACCTAASMLFVARCIPETRDRSLEEIEAHFQQHKK